MASFRLAPSPSQPSVALQTILLRLLSFWRRRYIVLPGRAGAEADSKQLTRCTRPFAQTLPTAPGCKPESSPKGRADRSP